MLPKKAIDEFKQLYKEKYGEELNDFVATESANRLVQTMSLAYKPIPKEWKEKHDEIEKEQKSVPKEKKIDFVKHLVSDAKVTEFRNEIGDKKFWELVRQANKEAESSDSEKVK